MNNLANRFPISGFGLKMIAVVTMLTDHTGASVLERLLMNTAVLQQHWTAWYWVYLCMRIIGRMAFPIYCFLLVEGFHYTRSRIKYAARLFVFALISELPFDTALFNTWYDPGHNNVFITLFLGLVMLMAVDKLWELNKEAQGKGSLLYVVYLILIVATVAGIAYVAESVLCTDYGNAGIACILIQYVFRRNKIQGFVFGVIALTLLSSTLEAAALLMVIPMLCYDGTRGRKVNKYLFYAFYPAHLTVLAVICRILGLGL